MNIMICSKIKVNLLLVFLLIFMAYSGFLSLGLMLIFSIVFHELGHLLFIKLFGGKIKYLHLGFFGGTINVNVNNMNNKFQKLLINLGGSNC